MIGRDVLNYTIESPLGQGGMATVWKARHKTLGSYSAIKVLNPHLALDASLRDRFVAEARTLATLQHPHIVRVYDYLETDDGLYLIMEFVEGESLDELLQRSGPLTEDRVRKLFGAMLEGFSYAHTRGLIHRDIKPSNIIIAPGDKPVIIDFGIAKILESPTDPTHTRTGMRIGTPAFMSPEGVNARPLDKRSDIYALGVTLFNMLTGRAPYNTDTHSEFELLQKIVFEPLPPLRQFQPDASEEMQALVSRATEKSPEARFPDCESFLAALREEASQSAAPSSSFSVAATPTPPTLQPAAPPASPPAQAAPPSPPTQALPPTPAVAPPPFPAAASPVAATEPVWPPPPEKTRPTAVPPAVSSPAAASMPAPAGYAAAPAASRKKGVDWWIVGALVLAAILGFTVWKIFGKGDDNKWVDQSTKDSVSTATSPGLSGDNPISTLPANPPPDATAANPTGTPETIPLTPTAPVAGNETIGDEEKAAISTALNSFYQAGNDFCNVGSILSHFSFPLTKYYNGKDLSYDGIKGEYDRTCSRMDQYAIAAKSYTVQRLGTGYRLNVKGAVEFATAASPDNKRTVNFDDIVEMNETYAITAMYKRK